MRSGVPLSAKGELLLLAFALVPACGQPSQSQTDQIQKAINVIKGIKPALGNELGRYRILDKIKVNDLGRRRGGTLSDGSASKAGDTIHLDDSLFASAPLFDCTLEFVWLVCTLIHEADHADRADVPSDSELDDKRRKVDREITAWTETETCLIRFREAIQAVEAGMAPPLHFAFLVDCQREGTLGILKEIVRLELREAQRTLDLLTKVLLDGSLFADQINRMVGRIIGSRMAGRVVENIWVDDSSPKAVVFNLITLRFQIVETPLIHPTTAVSLKAASAFLIAGTNNIAEPTNGQVVLVRDVNLNNEYDTVVTLHDRAGLKVPSSIFLHGEFQFVFDSVLRKGRHSNWSIQTTTAFRMGVVRSSVRFEEGPTGPHS